MTFWELTFWEVDILAVDISGLDILGVDILGVDILGGTQTNIGQTFEYIIHHAILSGKKEYLQWCAPLCHDIVVRLCKLYNATSCIPETKFIITRKALSFGKTFAIYRYTQIYIYQ